MFFYCLPPSHHVKREGSDLDKGERLGEKERTNNKKTGGRKVEEGGREGRVATSRRCCGCNRGSQTWSHRRGCHDFAEWEL